MEYSIIIPTYNNFEECLRPCLDSVLKHTAGIGTTVEVIVVANGCTDGTEDFVRGLGNGVKLLSFPDPLGYTKAVNTGLGVATGEYVILLNNDCTILDFADNNAWVDILRAPFEDSAVGITGPSKLYSEEARAHFIIFFCAMIPRKLFFEVGYLDETFNPGGGEDIDFCMRLVQAGYKLARVPFDGDDWTYQTQYPIYHAGERTVHTMVEDWENKFARRMHLIKTRTDVGYYSNFADVTCEISTKGRYFTTLPLAIMSVILQELKPKRFILFQDDPDECDLRKHDVYIHLFDMLTRAGIQWEVVFGSGKGQVLNHQRALEMSTTEWVWRLDDDNYAESNVLRLLMNEGSVGVAAVGPSVVDPHNPSGQGNWSTKIHQINTHGNVQWVGPGYPEVLTTDHLYSTFIYRRSAGLVHGYDMNLSPVGHREETIFTYNMRRDGHKLIVSRAAVVWHLRQSTGGIRSQSDITMWARDEEHFAKLCARWDVSVKQRLWVNLDGGKGDHYMFRMALPDIRKAHPNSIITVCSAHPDCLEGELGLDIRSVSDGMSDAPDFEGLSIYRWCTERKWTGSFVDAFKEIYK